MAGPRDALLQDRHAPRDQDAGCQAELNVNPVLRRQDLAGVFAFSQPTAIIRYITRDRAYQRGVLALRPTPDGTSFNTTALAPMTPPSPR